MKSDSTEREMRFARIAVGRKRLFLLLSAIGVAVGIAMAAYFGYRRLRDPGFALGLRLAVVVLILLNARQNLRQFRYAVVLEKLLR